MGDGRRRLTIADAVSMWQVSSQTIHGWIHSKPPFITCFKQARPRAKWLADEAELRAEEVIPRNSVQSVFKISLHALAVAEQEGLVVSKTGRLSIDHLGIDRRQLFWPAGDNYSGRWAPGGWRGLATSGSSGLGLIGQVASWWWLASSLRLRAALATAAVGFRIWGVD